MTDTMPDEIYVSGNPKHKTEGGFSGMWRVKDIPKEHNLPIELEKYHHNRVVEALRGENERLTSTLKNCNTVVGNFERSLIKEEEDNERLRKAVKGLAEALRHYEDTAEYSWSIARDCLKEFADTIREAE